LNPQLGRAIHQRRKRRRSYRPKGSKLKRLYRSACENNSQRYYEI